MENHYKKCRDKVIRDIVNKFVFMLNDTQLTDFVVLFPNIQEQLKHIDEYNHKYIQSCEEDK